MPRQESRELDAVREIAHAFLVAEHPRDVQQFALDRVTPILGAAFSLVMELSADGQMLRPVAQHEWPERHRPWIGALRVRVGDGPSGVAVAERRLVEVEDLFADESLEIWRDVAMELHFRSIIAAPLDTADGPIGAVAFYFADATSHTDEQRGLVQLVADQLAAATDKARRTDALRRSNAALAEANAELEAQARAFSTADRARDLLERRVIRSALALSDTLSPSPDRATVEREAPLRLAAIHALALAARELADLLRPGYALDIQEIDPRTPLHQAIALWRQRAPGVTIHVEEPTVLLPTMLLDAHWLTRSVVLALGLALRTGRSGGSILARVTIGRGFLAINVRWTIATPLAPPHAESLVAILEDATWEPGAEEQTPVRRHVTAVDVALLRTVVRRLGGELRIDAVEQADGVVGSLVLLFPVTEHG